MKKIILQIIIFFGICIFPISVSANFMNTFWVWFWGSWAFPFINNSWSTTWVQSSDLVLDTNIKTNLNYTNIKWFNVNNFWILQTKLNKSKYVVFWLTNGWQESWFNIPGIQKLMDNWKIPVFMYWYFWDTLNWIPTNIEKTKYYNDSTRLNLFLKKLNWTKLVILEPEFNKNSITIDQTTQHNFASMINTSIGNIKNWLLNTFFSLSMMDAWSRWIQSLYCTWYVNCSFWDDNEWLKPQTIYNDLSGSLDFISFSEMVWQFSRNPLNPWTWNTPIPISYTDWEIGINNLPKRIENLTYLLNTKYNKPIFLPYLWVMTATWWDVNNNMQIDTLEINNVWWENKLNQTFSGLLQKQSILKTKWLFWYATMSLFDDPMHDNPGYQFFMQNEYHLWIIKTTATWWISQYADWNISFKGNILDNIFTTSWSWTTTSWSWTTTSWSWTTTSWSWTTTSWSWTTTSWSWTTTSWSWTTTSWSWTTTSWSWTTTSWSWTTTSWSWTTTSWSWTTTSWSWTTTSSIYIPVKDINIWWWWYSYYYSRKNTTITKNKRKKRVIDSKKVKLKEKLIKSKKELLLNNIPEKVISNFDNILKKSSQRKIEKLNKKLIIIKDNKFKNPKVKYLIRYLIVRINLETLERKQEKVKLKEKLISSKKELLLNNIPEKVILIFDNILKKSSQRKIKILNKNLIIIKYKKFKNPKVKYLIKYLLIRINLEILERKQS